MRCRPRLTSTPASLLALTSRTVWHAIPAAANLGLDAVCLHTGTFGLRPKIQRPPELPIETVIGLAHQAGLEVLAWSPTPAMAVRLAPPAPTRSRSTISRGCWPPWGPEQRRRPGQDPVRWATTNTRRNGSMVPYGLRG